jgi:hypothetical protein
VDITERSAKVRLLTIAQPPSNIADRKPGVGEQVGGLAHPSVLHFAAETQSVLQKLAAQRSGGEAANGCDTVLIDPPIVESLQDSFAQAEDKSAHSLFVG